MSGSPPVLRSGPRASIFGSDPAGTALHCDNFPTSCLITYTCAKCKVTADASRLFFQVSALLRCCPDAPVPAFFSRAIAFARLKKVKLEFRRNVLCFFTVFSLSKKIFFGKLSNHSVFHGPLVSAPCFPHRPLAVQHAILVGDQCRLDDFDHVGCADDCTRARALFCDMCFAVCFLLRMATNNALG